MSTVCSSATPVSWRQVTSSSDFQSVVTALRQHGSKRSQKLLDSFERYLQTQIWIGDQGKTEKDVPVIYTNDDLSNLSVVLILYGNGTISEVLKRASQPRTISPTSSSSSQTEVDWRQLETSFYVTWCVLDETCAHSQALLRRMLHALVPTHESFWFSCIPNEFRDNLISFAADSNACLEWNYSAQWHCTLATFRPSTDDAQRRILDASTNSNDLIVSPNSSNSSSTSSQLNSDPTLDTPNSANSSPTSPTAPNVTVGPLRLEHVDVVNKNWPWGSPTSAALIHYLISNSSSLVTRCVYVDGVPASWCLEQTYGAIGMVHTQPEFRGRGYGRLCVESAVAAVFAREPSRSIYATITVGNDASEGLFTKLGFTKSHEVFWTQFQPNNKSNK